MDGEATGRQRRVSRRDFHATLSMAAASQVCGDAAEWASLGQLGKTSCLDRNACCVRRALRYLERNGRDSEGGPLAALGIGERAIVTTAMLQHGVDMDHPVVARGLRCLVRCTRLNGAIAAPGQKSVNRDTCQAILCLTAANGDHLYDGILDRAEAYVRARQRTESRGTEPDDLAYGGAGDGRRRRPDLFNTSLLIDALRARGASADDAAVRKALVFVSRCQNIESAHNTTPFAVQNPDGGFYDTCDAGGHSKAGCSANGGLKSYGSATSDGLRSMLQAGLTADEPRARVAAHWVRRHYTVRSNAGLGSTGFFYYCETLARALAALDADVVEDASGTGHNWRQELTDALRGLQRPDGSWTNENGRWMEGEPAIATARALAAILYCRVAET